ncbi:aminotransferase class IV [Romboutsia sp.]|uniref:aminotransferase class IV n=1 Tax=Romboutsia sp. TaxID=1965302 RepID=UPI003F3A3E83
MRNNISFNSTLSKFGIGLFETIKVKDCPVNLEFHMDRLFNSIKSLELEINLEKSILEQEILEYIKINECYNKALRVTVFDEGYNISSRYIPYNDKDYVEGFKIDISPIRRGESILYRHKTTNYFENIYTKNYANSKGFNDGLFLNTEGIVLECSMSNIFFIKENIVFTPSSKLPILNGTKKKRILEVCEELNIILIEDEININEIERFDFAFVSNSLMEVMKVVKIGEIDYDNKNQIFEKIVEALNK